MAKCIMIFEDNEDGSLETKINFEPEIIKGEKPTPAQIMGLCYMQGLEDADSMYNSKN